MDFLGVDSTIGGLLDSYGAVGRPLAAGMSGLRAGQARPASVEAPHTITRAGYKSTLTALDLLPAVEQQHGLFRKPA